MNKTFFIAILLLCGTLTGIAQPLTDIRIVNEDQQSVVLEFTPHINIEHVIGTHGGVFTRYRFFESQTTFDSTGQADFSRNILLLFPSPRYSFQVLESDFQIRDSIKLLPKPILKSLKDFGISESYDDSKFVQDARFSSQRARAEVVHVGKTSMGYIGTLLLRPIQVIDKERVRVYSRITVRFVFKDVFPDGMRSTCLLRGELPQKTQLTKTTQSGLRKTTAGNFPFEQGDWYRIDVTDATGATSAGMYKIDFTYLRSLNITVSDINSIRIFGNGGLVIPDNNTDPRPDSLVEIPRLVVRKKGSLPDTGDYIIFYGRGVTGWKYNGSNNFQHYINPYTIKNCYFFTVSQYPAMQMDSIVSPNPTSASAQYFQDKIFKEQEQTNLLNTGRRWFGKEFTIRDNSDTYYNSLPGIVSNSQINYLFNFIRRSQTPDVLNISESGNPLPQMPISMDAIDLGDGGEQIPFVNEFSVNATGILPQTIPTESSVIKIQVTTDNETSMTWLDWLEIYYQRKFEALNDALLFTTPDTAGSIQYTVNNLSSDIRAFDVTNHNAVKQIIVSQTGSSSTFQLQQTGGIVREIAVVGKNGYQVPTAATKIDKFIPNNLHDFPDQIDFIIISPAEFLSEANRLKAYRQLHDSLNTLVVDIQQIFNEFSGGLPDPLSVREFLKYTQDNWVDPKPRYVLLFGDGYFDYKNILTNQRNWIPPYETDYSFSTVESYATDDKFVMLGPSDSYALAIGRLPVRSLKDAVIMVDKIISYENAPIDPWRNRLTFVGDDGKTTEGDDGSVYTDHSEAIAGTHALDSFEENKIFEVAYPTVNSGGGRRKPDVNKAIVDAINSGTVIINYIGHGNERLWAHEAVFTREDNLPQLFNKDRLTFAVTASCSFGWYDNPNEVSGAEQMVTMEQGGAIADFTASRVVYDPLNFSLNVSLFSYLLQRNSIGQFPRIGDACFLAKLDNSNSVDFATNTQKFHLFGDPTLRLLMPKNAATIDSINRSSVAANDTIKIKSLGHARIVGTIKQNNTIMSSFNGEGILRLFDSQKQMSIVDGIATFNFTLNGSILFSGDVSVKNGNFIDTIPIPKDVTFGKSARISIYAWSGQSDGTGNTENVMIDGIDTSAVKDTVGPIISVYLDTISFRPGDVVKSNPIIIVQLEDESGINTSTVGVGHQILATINNPVRTFDLSSYYSSSLNNYKKGVVSYPLHDLADGKYTLTVKAWDIQNNSSQAETFFEVHSADDFAMLNAVNYPNPFSHSTTFTFQRTSSDPIDVEIKIYSIAGRLIGNIKAHNIAENFVRIPWDGKDNDGNALANGIYFYKLIARDNNSQRSNETIGKLAVMR